MIRPWLHLTLEFLPSRNPFPGSRAEMQPGQTVVIAEDASVSLTLLARHSRHVSRAVCEAEPSQESSKTKSLVCRADFSQREAEALSQPALVGMGYWKL